MIAELRALIAPGRVRVVTALGTLTSDDIRRLGFQAVSYGTRIWWAVQDSKVLTAGG